jgi:hypothetical protein
MSHHYSGPDFGFPHGDARLDLTDLYAFPKPGDADKSILMMNVHPSAVVNPPGPTAREPFAPTASYEFKIDTNGDAVADIAYRVRFSYRFFAGWRSDPFFFDTRGALNDLQFTGDDFFIDKDVCSIVLEMPSSALGPKRVGLWARTLDGAGGVWVQADRGALPAQAVFLVGSEREAYLAGEPANDARFVAVFAHALEHTGGYAPEEARRVAGTLLPDMLSYDPTRPASFPSNGRTLTDDAADAFLAVLTNGKVTGDKVGAHVDLLAEFPYLGPPHNISVPSHATSPIATELRKASRRPGSS